MYKQNKARKKYEYVCFFINPLIIHSYSNCKSKNVQEKITF
jgi:hypothetical protein